MGLSRDKPSFPGDPLMARTRRLRLEHFLTLLWVAAFALLAHADLTAQDHGKLKAYIERLTDASPRSADSFVTLALWCKESGLERQSRLSYERAVQIDTDCAPARKALGYERYGTVWRLKGSKPPSTRRAKGDSGTVKARTNGRPSRSNASNHRAGKSSSRNSSRTARSNSESSKTTAEEIRAQSPSAIDEKKAWIEKVTTTFGSQFNLKETSDFLIYSSVEKRSRKLKQLTDMLSKVRRSTGKILGTGSRGSLWPNDKMLIVLLRSEPEFERFALNIDNIKAVNNPDGAYTTGHHTVLWKPTSPEVVRVIGRQAVKTVHTNNRWIAPWMAEGLAELLVAATPATREEHQYENTYISASDILRAAGEDDERLFTILEKHQNYSTSETRVLNMTLVDFLRNEKKFDDLVKMLKSEEAPEPPPDLTKSKEFAPFFMRYVSFQEEALKKRAKVTPTQLNEKWRDFVFKRAERSRALVERVEQKRRQTEKAEREKNRRRGRTRTR